MFLKRTVDNLIVEYTLGLLEEIKNTRADLLDQTNICTVDGIQTKNVVELFSCEQRQQLVQDVLHPETLKWLHIIEYGDGGYQKRHDHKETEDWSFILYLNDSDGDTILYCDDMDIHFHPIKGNIIYFKSDVLHEGLKSTKNKKVLVGALSALKC